MPPKYELFPYNVKKKKDKKQGPLHGYVCTLYFIETHSEIWLIVIYQDDHRAR